MLACRPAAGATVPASGAKHPPSKGQNRPYTLVEYDPQWPQMYEDYKNKILAIFWNMLVDIQHVGSTSIPGMFGKPNIDIYGAVHDIENVKNYYHDMKLAGFACHGDYSGIGEEYFTIENETGERIVSFHVFNKDTDSISRYKNFRDYLVQFEDERERYIKLKRDLYSKYKNDYEKYDNGKQEFIEEIKNKANLWAGHKLN